MYLSFFQDDDDDGAAGASHTLESPDDGQGSPDDKVSYDLPTDVNSTKIKMSVKTVSRRIFFP